MNNIKSLHVPSLPPALKHSTVFRLFDELIVGDTLLLTNDHDPKPLYYELIAERGLVFSWQYLEKGPRNWRVEIRRHEAEEETVGGIAAADLRKAEVFKKYGIDFCCGGKKSLRQACSEAGADLAVVEADLARAEAAPQRGANDFNRWEPDFLADFIYNQHHKYYYDHGPVIADLLQKVLHRHGAHYPELPLLATAYAKLQEELKEHFEKEEQVVFPFIKSIVQTRRTGDRSALDSLPSLSEPVKLMESDHEAAGGLLAVMRKLTNDYQAPEGSCNSYQFLYRKLHELEEDLHQHVHLENNLLFPKALKLEKELRGA